MTEQPTRREFLERLSAAGAVLGSVAGVGPACAEEPSTGVMPLGSDREAIRNELRRRAAREIPQRRLVVDYYRIRRKLAYPLPVERISLPEVPVPGIDDYPWTVWMTWALEERIGTLGWAAEWLGDRAAQTAAAADLVLRSGWRAEDMAVAVSCSNSPMDHMQADSGTLVVGTRGRRLISDPGCQQYMPGEEHEFTLGPTAHNTPVINGSAVSRKQPRRLALEAIGPDARHAAVDLTACYPDSLGLSSVVRQVWLSADGLAVVADRIVAASAPHTTYHWHGHPDAAWWIDDRWAMLAVEQTQIWFTSPLARLRAANLHRLPASRGQLTLITEIEPASAVVWWVFAVGSKPPELPADPSGDRLRIADREFLFK